MALMITIRMTIYLIDNTYTYINTHISKMCVCVYIYIYQIYLSHVIYHEYICVCVCVCVFIQDWDLVWSDWSDLSHSPPCTRVYICTYVCVCDWSDLPHSPIRATFYFMLKEDKTELYRHTRNNFWTRLPSILLLQQTAVMVSLLS